MYNDFNARSHIQQIFASDLRDGLSSGDQLASRDSFSDSIRAFHTSNAIDGSSLAQHHLDSNHLGSSDLSLREYPFGDACGDTRLSQSLPTTFLTGGTLARSNDNYLNLSTASWLFPEAATQLAQEPASQFGWESPPPSITLEDFALLETLSSAGNAAVHDSSTSGFGYNLTSDLPHFLSAQPFTPISRPASACSGSSISGSWSPSPSVTSLPSASSSRPPSPKAGSSTPKCISKSRRANSEGSNTRQKRFPCLVVGCNRRFTSQYTLKVHLKAHAPKPRTSFPCTMGCSERFSRQHDRLRHEVAKHGKVCEFSCEDCGRFFSSKTTLGHHKCPASAGQTRWVS